MRKFINSGMAFPAADFSVNGLFVQGFVDIIDVLLSGLINSSQSGILMTQEAVLLVNSVCP